MRYLAKPCPTAARLAAPFGLHLFADCKNENKRWRREEISDVGDARAMARCAFGDRGDPGSLCGAEPGSASRRERRTTPEAPACGSRPVARRRNLVDAFRRYAGSKGTVPGRPPGLSHAAATFLLLAW